MKKRDLSADYIRSIFDCNPETGVVTRRQVVASDNRWGTLQRVGEEVGHFSPREDYWRVSVPGVYRAIKRAEINWVYFKGEWPPVGMIVDHENRVRTDDAIGNLRLATRSQNQRNCIRPKNNTSGAKGVCWDKKNSKWMAYIKVDGKSMHLGRYETKEQAASARELAAYLYHGEFEGAA